MNAKTSQEKFWLGLLERLGSHRMCPTLTRDRKSLYSSQAMINHFIELYRALYNLLPSVTSLPGEDRFSDICQYLADLGLLLLSQSECQALDDPLTSE